MQNPIKNIFHNVFFFLFFFLQKSEMFADVRELSTERKLVKTVCEQEESESRRVWRDVTVGLRINDMDKATAAKCAIEQKQREEARIRKETNVAWQTKVSERFLFDPFHPSVA